MYRQAFYLVSNKSCYNIKKDSKNFCNGGNFKKWSLDPKVKEQHYCKKVILTIEHCETSVEGKKLTQ